METHNRERSNVRNLRRARHSGASGHLDNSDGPLGHCLVNMLMGLAVPLSVVLMVVDPACASYWTFGPSITYAIGAIAMAGLSALMQKVARRTAVKVA